MTAAVRTASGTYVIDVDAEEVIGAGDDFESPRVAVDPTGSGDAFSAAYLAGRSQGLAPVSAARQATGVVGALLTGRLT